MSMKLMVRVLEEIDVTRPQQAVLLAMAENAEDDGSKCFPSVDLIAWKAGYKPRAVVDIMRELRKMGVIDPVKEATARRPTEYRIHLKNAPQKITFEQWQEVHGRHAKGVRRGAVSREVQNDEGCNLTSLGVQSHVKNARENAPEPVIEPVKTHKSDEPAKTKPQRTRPEHGPAQQIMAAFCDAVGIERLANYSVAAGHAKNLVKAGITADDIPDMVRWCFEQDWMDGGIDLGTLYRHADKWRSHRQKHKTLKPKGPPGVDLLPGETPVQVGPDAWDLIGSDGRKRSIRPEYYGVIFDERKHTYDGYATFVRERTEAERRANRQEQTA